MTRRPRQRDGAGRAAGPLGPRGPRRRARLAGALALLGVAALWASPALADPPGAGGAAHYRCRVVAEFPHDPEAFTQGLTYAEGHLYESTGLHGRSSVRRVRLETGEVLARESLDAAFFGEGLTVWRDTLVQLTWRSWTGFVRDLRTLAERRRFRYATEGWGLTHDGVHLIMSDGTPVLQFLDPDTFRPLRSVTVRAGGVPVANLNELEFVRGEIFANVWQSERLARIDPDSGAVRGWVDLTGLRERAGGRGVANGVAFDAAGGRLFVTGKLWTRVFQVEIVAAGFPAAPERGQP